MLSGVLFGVAVFGVYEVLLGMERGVALSWSLMMICPSAVMIKSSTEKPP